MWFSLRKTRLNNQTKGTVRFLRKALPERKDHRTLEAKQGGRKTGAVYLLWTVFLGTLFYLFFFSSFIVVEKIQIEGMSEIPETTLRSFVDDQLTGKYFGIFPKRAFTLIQPQVLEQRLRLEYPLLASVLVKRVFPNSLRISVSEKKKIILWNSGDASYLVDEEGIIHDASRALLAENSAYVITIVDTSSKPVALGEKVFDASYGTFIVSMDEMFSPQLGLTLEPRYTVVSRFAEELRAKTDEGWEVYFGTGIPIETSLNALRLLFEKELPQEKRANLAYIDLRVENRVYYAFRDGTNGEVIAPPAANDVKKQDTAKDVTPKKKKK